MTIFNIFIFFRVLDLIQSEVNWMLPSASDWLMTSRKNVKKLKWPPSWAPCCSEEASHSLIKACLKYIVRVTMFLLFD